jgi:hypothetical protein
MKYLFIFIIGIFVSIQGFSQGFVSLKFSPMFTKFEYKDSLTKVDPNMKSDLRWSYAVDYKNVLPFGLYVGGELGYKNMGAISSVNDQKLDWNLHYLDLNLGLGYIYNKAKIQPYVGVAFYFAYLFKANQSVGSNNYDMLYHKAIKASDFGFNGNVGLKFAISNRIGLFGEFQYTRGLQQLEQTNTQKMYNTGMGVRVGLSFLIENTNSRYNFMF